MRERPGNIILEIRIKKKRGGKKRYKINWTEQ